MIFKKGNVPWNKKLQKEHFCIECGVSFFDKQSKKRVYCSKKCLYKGLSERYTGRKITEEEKERLRSYNYNRVFTKEHKENLSKAHKGNKNSQWKGGRRIDKSGYVLIYSPLHPNRDKDNIVREHRLIMESKIGRFLKKGEIVHHMNDNKSDNRIENLQLLTKIEHAKLHYKDKLQ